MDPVQFGLSFEPKDEIGPIIVKRFKNPKPQSKFNFSVSWPSEVHTPSDDIDYQHFQNESEWVPSWNRISCLSGNKNVAELKSCFLCCDYGYRLMATANPVIQREHKLVDFFYAGNGRSISCNTGISFVCKQKRRFPLRVSMSTLPIEHVEKPSSKSIGIPIMVWQFICIYEMYFHLEALVYQNNMNFQSSYVIVRKCFFFFYIDCYSNDILFCFTILI